MKTTRCFCITLLVMMVGICGSVPSQASPNMERQALPPGVSAVRTIRVPAEVPTIQAGLDAAQEGDTVLVSPGVYYEHLIMKSGVALICDDTQRGCIVSEDEAPSLSRALLTCQDCNASTLIEGFTIRGANGHRDAYGYGIILVNSDTTVSNNSIVDNYYCTYDGSYMVAYGGQGIEIRGGGKPQIVGNLISNNRTYRFGGGISVSADSGAIIIGNIFKGNRVFNWGPDCRGGGLAIASNDVFVSNNVFDSNFASGNHEHGGGVYVGSGVRCQYIGNNIFVGNRPFAVESMGYNDFFLNVLHNNMVEGPLPQFGSLVADPQFVDPAADDYHLSETSPAIDKGDPRLAFNDPQDPARSGFAVYPALGGLRNDAGAFGGSPTALADYARFGHQSMCRYWMYYPLVIGE